MRLSMATHIPAGSIRISKEDFNVDPKLWNSQPLRTWRLLVRRDDIPSAGCSESSEEYLHPDIQESLLKVSHLRFINILFYKRWVSLEFLPDSGCEGSLRVYLLPDDVQRRIVDRSDPTLWQARCVVLRDLDYSKESWNGVHESPRINSPIPYEGHQTLDEEMSLLQLFNKIPSPDPVPDSLVNGYAQDAMLDLLDSSVPGLLTKLYPYQRRSAALMVQKEARQGQVLDPRLIQFKDQQGSSWYMDPISGTILLEPRYYDGISGGILAEEMGAGKTVICLALILATNHLPTPPPEIYRVGEMPIRCKVASLADMAASCATRNAVPWKAYFDAYKTQLGLDFTRCTETLARNPGYYFLPAPTPRRSGRHTKFDGSLPKKICLSPASLIIVPNNLLAQWRQEISKHTQGLAVVVLAKDDEIPGLGSLLQCDIIIMSQSRFEKVAKQEGLNESLFSQMHFKRCIVDEGHKLGNSRMSNRSNLLRGLDSLHFASRWAVTGTPSQGLFGMETHKTRVEVDQPSDSSGQEVIVSNTTTEMEKRDLERLGSIASLYLKARPWANTIEDPGDTLADWNTYLMLPKHNPKSRGQWAILKSTLSSLIIRHQLSEVSDLLPPVDERTIVLDGSYQDRLSLNLFSMMVIFNSVQSQRVDKDYFFHPKQRKSLVQIVHNLKQTSFFGGSFFPSEDIATSVQTAEDFLNEGKIPISQEDGELLRDAIDLGRLAVANNLRDLSNQFHEMPVLVENFPGGAGHTWSLDNKIGDTACTSASLLLTLQKLIYNSAAEPAKLNSLLNGGLVQMGLAERDKILYPQGSEQPQKLVEKKSQTLAGNTKLGDDSPRKHSHGVNGVKSKIALPTNAFSGPLELSQITSTVSAKLSYLIDSIICHQDEDKIIVFYENDNVAWYLVSMLDVLQIQHLIYAKGLTMERRAQYVHTFHHNPTFRVLLMDLSQAAFGLDIRVASRIYFINPVLNPQVEAQAIGRVRRISQQKPVSVETLVLKGSIDEVLLERKKHMTQAEHRQVKSILDIRPIYNWIKNASILPMPSVSEDNACQMAPLESPLQVFGKNFGRSAHPDEGIILDEQVVPRNVEPLGSPTPLTNGIKRAHDMGPGGASNAEQRSASDTSSHALRPAQRIRFNDDLRNE